MGMLTAEPDDWPPDPDGYTFLARAFREVGRITFGDEWTGEEIFTEDVKPLPPSALEEQFVIQERACHLLFKHRPDLAPPVGSTGYFVLSSEQYRAAYDLDRELYPKRVAALGRLHRVHADFASAVRAGKLATAFSGVKGSLNAVPKDWWNVSNAGLRERFRRFKLDPDYPMDDRPRYRDEKLFWIFVTRESFNGVFNAPSPSPGSYAATDAPLADRMKSMVDSRAAKSVRAAALQLAPQALGGGTLGSRAKRLEGVYRARFNKS